MYRTVWRRLGAPKLIPGRDYLRTREYFTRIYEAVHIAGFGVYTAIAAENFAQGKIGLGLFTTGMNALSNVYPIMLQRYNRIRLYDAINRTEGGKTQQDQTEFHEDAGQ